MTLEHDLKGALVVAPHFIAFQQVIDSPRIRTDRCTAQTDI